MKKKLLIVVAGFACALAAPAVRSEPAAESDTARAATRFQQAVELYREGSFEGALAEFRKAYQLSPSYRVLYNIAQTQYALHDFVGAYKSLTQYTNEGRGEISAERRAQVDDMSAKLSERIAHLHIVTNVEGAEVRVDDVVIGRTPFTELVPVNVGTRRVTLFRAGAPAAVRVVTGAGKEKMKVELLIDESEPTVPVFTQVSAPKTQPRLITDLSVGATKSQASSLPTRMGLYVSLSATAALAAGTGVFGYLAMSAQDDLNTQLKTFPNTRTNIEDARAKSKSYAAITDVLGAATLVAGGAALYFWLTDPPKEKAAKSVSVAPTAGGVVLHGTF